MNVRQSYYQTADKFLWIGMMRHTLMTKILAKIDPLLYLFLVLLVIVKLNTLKALFRLLITLDIGKMTQYLLI